MAVAVAAVATACGSNPTTVGAEAPPCGSCHGAPPDTGAHRVHATPQDPATVAYGSTHVLEDVATGGTAYDFGCGVCHPVSDAKHMDGTVEVDLDPAPAPAGSIKARNAAAAAYDPASGTCAGAYCHSSGQEQGTDHLGGAIPSYVRTPPWVKAGGGPWLATDHLPCDACHGNPPAYPSGGPGAIDANSHLDFDVTAASGSGWEFGHFAGLPGPWHNSKHGSPTAAWPPGQLASPITCQTCHADTVDPQAHLPGRAFWLNTQGTYRMADRPGWSGVPNRTADPGWIASHDCASCHYDGGPAPAGNGGVLPLRHVNGRRDVVFDAQAAQAPWIAALGSFPWLELSSGYPTHLAVTDGRAIRPYYVYAYATDPVEGSPLFPADAILQPVQGSTDLALSLNLASARYDPAPRTATLTDGSTATLPAKTCSSVACHLAQSSLVPPAYGAAYEKPLQWGAPYVASYTETCVTCHPM